MPLSTLEQTALAALDEQELLDSFRHLLRIPSVTGHEAAAQHWLGQHMRHLGLAVDLWTIDVPEMKKHPQFPGMEVDRSQHEAVGLVGTWQREATSATPGKRLIFNGHIDVVPTGDRANWQHDPWGAELEDDHIYGRGACDMKGGLMAALYAVKAIKDSGISLNGSLMVQSVIGEEDGGIGTFASILRGHTGDAAIVCEPTRLNLIPAQAGALTFTVRVPGKSAHACVRLEGVSAIEKYLDIHRVLIQLEKERNSEVEHPLLSKLRLPYPLSIGRAQAGNWSSSVPEGDPWLRNHPLDIQWSGGQFDSGEIAMDHALVSLCKQCMLDLTSREPAIEGAPYGSDLRLLVNLGGIPTLLFGPGDVNVAHMPDENVRVDEILLAARAYILAAIRFLL